MKKVLLFLFGGLLATAIIFQVHKSSTEQGKELASNSAWDEHIAKKSAKKRAGFAKMDSPDKLQAFHKGIRTRENEDAPSYQANYRFTELNKLKRRNRSARKASTPGLVEFIERGPANVPGRTRALVVMPQDDTHNTWFAGASGGGIWKTTDAGASWENKSADFPTLAVTSIAYAESDPNILYAGTGEYIASSGTAIEGDGIFKSTDAGETWTQLSSTASNDNFISVTRVIVDPNDENTLLVCSAPNTWGDFSSVIMKSTDGGTSWTTVYTVESGGAIEQLIADPEDFNTIYAGQNSVGVLKSTDAGDTWTISNTGMSPSGRVEIGVSPVNTNKLFASTQGSVTGNASDLYMSEDKGETWEVVSVVFNNTAVDFLGGQGWYDNTIICHPYNENIVYYGGVGLFRTEVGGGSSGSSTIVDFGDIPSFMAFVDFGAGAAGGTLEVGPSANGLDVAIKFGPDRAQMAHRFTIPEGEGAGVPEADYTYADYVEVPFEVYEVDGDGNEVRQLMVSFRDQEADGVFNLNVRDDANDPDLLTAREYVFVNNVDYDASSPDGSIATAGGHVFNEMYFFWPLLADGETWDADNLPESQLEILNTVTETLNSETLPIADPYTAWNGRNRYITNGEDVHPDQHYQVIIKEDDDAETFRIVLTNDGGVFSTDVSDDPGAAEGSWNFGGQSYNTSQFYGADKMPGGERYFGGMQDNGTWYSPEGEDASAASDYIFGIGGDGFEVIWHSEDPLLMIGGSQNNGLRRTTNGGQSWQTATDGLSGTPPFITKLAGSKRTPDVIYALSSAGVFRSTDFGGQWNLTPITSNWVGSTFLDAEVSRANPNIVWAGSGMSTTASIHVSTDGGVSYSATNNFDAALGTISKLASHPSEPNTAYVLFSFAQGPKVLKTEDLGQTWEEISGFGNNTTSSNGFPDVAVYCLYVRPDNTDIIWVGSEIGIIESLDGGETWALHDEFINAAVWDMKGQDNEIVMATHGRGIWSAVLDVDQNPIDASTVTGVQYAPNGDVILQLEHPLDYETVEVYANGELVYTGSDATVGTELVNVSALEAGTTTFETRGISDGKAAVSTSEMTFQVIELNEASSSYATSFGNEPLVIGSAFAVSFFDGDFALQTTHNYLDDSDIAAVIGTPITVSSDLPFIYFRDVAIVEPTNDKVSIEGTLDGINWTEIASYDASENSTWSSTFSSGGAGDRAMMISQEVDLSSVYDAGDLILIRFRLQSDSENNGWGWAIDNLAIQQAPTQVAERVNLDLTLAPNPVVNGNLKVTSNTGITYMELIDLSGKISATKRFNEFDVDRSMNLTGLNSGLYTLRVYTTEGYDTRKVVIKN